MNVDKAFCLKCKKLRKIRDGRICDFCGSNELDTKKQHWKPYGNGKKKLYEYETKIRISGSEKLRHTKKVRKPKKKRQHRKNRNRGQQKPKEKD